MSLCFLTVHVVIFVMASLLIAAGTATQPVAQCQLDTAMASMTVSKTTNDAFRFTEEEIKAMRSVKQELINRGIATHRLGDMEIAITTINQKMRVDDAADKYISWLDELKAFSLSSFDEVKNDFADFNTALAPLFGSYSRAGRDSQNRDIFWINGSRGVQVSEERDAVRAGVLYFLAIHTDPVSLREGITFVIDVSVDKKKVGNEKKMQRVSATKREG